MFPRSLNKLEISALFALLPSERKGYRAYREKIENLLVIGNGRFGDSNLILGKRNDHPDLENASAPILAAGAVVYNQTQFDIVIHEEIDGKIEIDLDGIDKISFNKDESPKIEYWSYSNWSPGLKAPGDNSELREIIFEGGRYVLAVAPNHKRLWLYDSKSEINHLIPVTNFYNELMMLKGIKERHNAGVLFTELFKFTDREIISAFVNYNRYMKKFIMSDIKINEAVKHKKNIFRFIKR